MSEGTTEKKKRLLAAMIKDRQKAPDQKRIEILDEVMARMNGCEETPVTDPTGLWRPEEIHPREPKGTPEEQDAQVDEEAAAAEETACDNPSDHSEQAGGGKQAEDEGASSERAHQHGEKAGPQNPYEALLGLLFPQLDADAFGDPATTFGRLFPHLEGRFGAFFGEHVGAQWCDPQTMESLFRAIPGMSQFLRILKEGPAAEVPRDKEPRHSPLIKINDRGARTPFFCVHAILGSVFHYHKLAALLPADQPFYALQAQGLDAREEPLDKIEDFVARYLPEIRKQQPHGPYKLGGYSFGSWVAFELAHQLLAEGEEVELLVLIGAGLPISMYAPALCANGGFAQKYLQDFRKMLLEPFLSYEERLSGGVDGMLDRFLTPLQRLYRAHFNAMTAYVPRTYPGKFVLLETIEQRASDAAIALGGWDRLAVDGVDSVLISGNHLSMLEEPHIHEVAQQLTTYLNNS